MKTHPVYPEADSVVNPRQDQWSRGTELRLIEIGVAGEFYLRARCAQNAEIFAVLFDALVKKRWHLQGFEKHQGQQYIVNISNFSTLEAPHATSTKTQTPVLKMFPFKGFLPNTWILEPVLTNSGVVGACQTLVCFDPFFFFQKSF